MREAVVSMDRIRSGLLADPAIFELVRALLDDLTALRSTGRHLYAFEDVADMSMDRKATSHSNGIPSDDTEKRLKRQMELNKMLLSQYKTVYEQNQLLAKAYRELIEARTLSQSVLDQTLSRLEERLAESDKLIKELNNQLLQ